MSCGSLKMSFTLFLVPLKQERREKKTESVEAYILFKHTFCYTFLIVSESSGNVEFVKTMI